jgi:hypothetical protein
LRARLINYIANAFAFRHTPIQAIPTHLQTDRAKLI